MMTGSIISIIAIVLFVGLSGLFSGSETGMYRLSRLRLRLGVEKKKRAFILLNKTMHDSAGLLLSMLVGTNLGNYLAASTVTLMLLNRLDSQHSAELFATLITAPVLFIFSELVPKNVFFYRADYLMPWCAPFLYVFYKVLVACGIVGLLKNCSRVFARLIGTPTSSKTVISDVREHHIKAILRETHEEGFLTPVQADIISRVVRIPNIRLRAVMTPMAAVAAVAKNSDKTTLLAKLKTQSFTRLLVYEGAKTNILGFINFYDVLAGPDDFADLGEFIKPVRRLSAETTVADAIDVMKQEKRQIALVVASGTVTRDRPVGIVTMKDLVEELLGELAEW